MSKTKLGESLMRTIDGGKSVDGTSTDRDNDDAFEQASRNDSAHDFGGVENDVSIGEEPKNGGTEEIISTGGPIEDSVRDKPEKVKRQKQKQAVGLTGVLALLFAFVALAVAGYLFISQNTGQEAVQESIESLDTVIGSLNDKTDVLTVELSGTQRDVTTNSERLLAVDGIRKDIQNLQTTITRLHGKLDGFKDSLVSQGASIEKHQKEIVELSKKIENLNTRPTSTPRKVVQREPVEKGNIDLSRIEGASVVSIDLWGAESYVMLREENNSWVPLTIGDYYKGWRLEGAIGSEAVFRKGSKTRRLMMTE
ncbi:MAG: hypothetical protein MI864_17185 [Pseudomonadales bacterium]|nr:hypothetical protein [Pseudomonadales bacterium]